MMLYICYILKRMSKRLNIFTSIALVLSMSLFNIGIPIVLYLCPMVETRSTCCQGPVENEDATHALSRQMHSCCDLIVGAERNTTPYRLTPVSQDYAFKLLAFLNTGASTEQERYGLHHVRAIDAQQDLIRLPLYVLNSSFLI